MLLTHRTDTRTLTFLVEIQPNDDFHMAVAVCHEVNGETGEIIEEYDPKIGRRMVQQRIKESPILLDGYSIFVAFNKAFRAGHRITLRDLIKESILTNIKLYVGDVSYDDNAYQNAINGIIAEQERSAWNEYEGEISDDEWFDEAKAMGLFDSSLDPYIFYNDSKSY